MSKIGKQPIQIKPNVTAELSKGILTVNGPKGTLSLAIDKSINAEIKDNQIFLTPKSEGKKYFAIWGTMRALAQNCIDGVSDGFEKRLIIEGIGYKAEVVASDLILNIGYSHQVKIAIPKDLVVTVEKTFIIITGNSKKSVGDFAAHVRVQRKTNPYSMKGIRYNTERVIKKSGKKAGA